MECGEVWWADFPEPVKRRPVLLLSRTKAIHVREFVTIAEITRTIRNIPTEVMLGAKEGLSKECVVNLDVINTIPKQILTEKISRLSSVKMDQIHKALKFALAIE
jgi:mRNA interferase MazF